MGFLFEATRATIVSDDESKWEIFRDRIIPWWMTKLGWKNRNWAIETQRLFDAHEEDMRIQDLRQAFINNVREFSHEERMEVFNQTAEEKEFGVMPDIRPQMTVEERWCWMGTLDRYLPQRFFLPGRIERTKQQAEEAKMSAELLKKKEVISRFEGHQI